MPWLGFIKALCILEEEAGRWSQEVKEGHFFSGAKQVQVMPKQVLEIKNVDLSRVEYCINVTTRNTDI